MAQDTLLGFPAHTLPYRRGEFTALLTVSRNVSMFLYKLVDCLEKCLIYGHIRRFAD